jgi:HD-GYP domain-containing protein (c-di-GMP phosphodiesterase class II)
MQDLLPGVLHHHERFDGKGYPHGLAGRDIPLFGRLICLADSFDAMSSNRTYRSAMPLENVLDEIRRCAGKQFDPDLAAVFVKLDFEPYQRMVDQHQHRTSLVIQAMGAVTP